MLYSFDVFDTLIMRTTRSPMGIFNIMQKKVEKIEKCSAYLKDNFASLRVEAEKKAREFATYRGLEEITLIDIYESLKELCDISETVIKCLMELEISVEMNSLYPIKEEIDIVKKLIENKEQVILISDMYLHRDIIRQMLVAQNDIFYNIPLYVSCDCGYTKASGELYAFIHDKLKIDYGQWYHVGDNYYSDYQVPQVLGINCTLLEKKTEYPWIAKLKNNNIINMVNYEIVSGMVGILEYDDEPALVQLGFSFGGIIIEAYAEWIVDLAKNTNVEELYFIARDGYVIKKVVDRIIAYYKYDITTYYIYGSRRAWRVNDNIEARKNVIRYFKENVNFQKRIAFVDANGYGISISKVSGMLEGVWQEKIPIYYFSLHKRVENQKCKFYNFCDARTDIIELLCSATHGTTIGYEEKDGHMIPKLEQFSDSNLNKVMNEYVKGVLKYTDLYLHVRNKLQIEINTRDIAVNLATNQLYSSHMNISDLWNVLNGGEYSVKQEEQKYYKLPVSNNIISRVVIYGAGCAGKQLYNQWEKEAQINIVAWVDINYEKYRNNGLPVTPIRKLLKVDYDYIILAIKNKMAIKSAKCILKELGVEESKIYCLNEYLLVN